MRNVLKGIRGQPIAVEFLFGVSLLGLSLSFSASRNCLVNFVRTDPNLQTQINCLWEADFRKETSVFDIFTSKEDRVLCDIMVNLVELLQDITNYLQGRVAIPSWKIPDMSGTKICMVRRVNL